MLAKVVTRSNAVVEVLAIVYDMGYGCDRPSGCSEHSQHTSHSQSIGCVESVSALPDRTQKWKDLKKIACPIDG